MFILIFIISIAVLVFVHELGHFLVAKKFGIRVDEFGIGFPPRLFSKRIGETLYSINAIPFGGFVKIFGEDQPEGEEDKGRSFFWKPKWIKSLVLVAGVTFNLLFAWLLISLGFMIGMPSSVENARFGHISNPEVVVVNILPNSPAEKAGLYVGDTIVSASSGAIVLEKEALTAESLQKMIFESKSGDVSLSYARGSSEITKISMTPSLDIVAGQRAIGVATDNIGIQKLPIHLALIAGGEVALSITKDTVVGLLSFFKDIFTFESDFSQVSGPVGIANIFSKAEDLGFIYILSLVALISINLAVINLLPFPALDGGRLFFILIEIIIRRPIPSKFVHTVNILGFIFLILLTLVVTGHDILKIV